MQPKLAQNVVLMYSGQFKGLLNDLLKDEAIESEFYSLFDGFAFSWENQEGKKLLEQLKQKLFKDMVSGAFNRLLWGNLKQIKPDNNKKPTLRNSLKLNLSTATPFSSLQVN